MVLGVQVQVRFLQGEKSVQDHHLVAVVVGIDVVVDMDVLLNVDEEDGVGAEVHAVA